MNILTRFGIEHSRFTILNMFLLLLLGSLLFFSFPKREEPAITVRTAVVTTLSPGMAPEKVEELIAVPIERRAKTVGAVDKVRSLVTTGKATVFIDLKDSVLSKDIESVFQDLRNQLSDISTELPDNVQGPFINTNYGDVTIASVAIIGPGFSFAEMKDAAEELRRRLHQIDSLAKIDIFGEQEERIWLEVDARKLASIGVSLSQVIQDLRAQNVILPAGTLDAEGENVLLEASGDLESVEDIGNVLTKIRDVDGYLQLKELMTVRRGYEDPKSSAVYFNGYPALVVAVQMQAGQDILAVSQRIHDIARAYEAELPFGIQFDFATYQAEKVEESINGALSNVGQTFAVVVLVLLLFIGFRSSLIVASIVPFTVMFALIGMKALGLELHQVSIAAVIISLGLLVDNGLVMVEDVERRIKNGADSKEAALSAGKQFMIPLLVASVTTISAFFPMVLIDGSSGEYAISLATVIFLMLAGSWLTAMYILPALCVWFLSSKAGNDTGNEEAGSENKLGLLYEPVVKLSLKFAPLVLILAYAATFLSLNLFGQLDNQQFPNSERNQFMIYVDMPKGASIKQTDAVSLDIAKWLSDKTANPDVKNHIAYVGTGGPRFNLGLNPNDDDASMAFILVNTGTYAEAQTAADRARHHLNLNFPEARFKVKQLSMGGSESGIVEVKITGPDADRLLVLAREASDIFATVPGINQNENDWGNKVFKVFLDIDQVRAREYQITSEQIAQSMNVYFDGQKVSDFRDGDESIPIMVRTNEAFRDTLDDLENMMLSDRNNTMLSLDQIGMLKPLLEYANIRRENQRRQIVVSGKSSELKADKLLEYIEPELAKLDLTGGYQIEIGGELEEAAKTNGQLAAGLPYTFMIMLIAITFQFNSLRRTLLTFMTIPLILAGVPFGLLITGMPFSFFGILGLISLAGIIINNAIVLIDQIDIELERMVLYDAIVTAAKKRIRPILLTTVTTVFGLLPMAIGGGALWEPMAVVMMGGLLVASVMTLLFVPAGYYLLFKRSATTT